jgi:branched-chain amino acid transport system substrate-binding protein
LVSLGKKKIALVYDPTIGEQAAKQDADFAKKSGAQIVTEISVPATTTNYTPVVQKVRESGADGIVFQVAAPGLAGTMKAAGQAGLKLPAVSYSGLVDASVLKLGGTALEGVYFTALFPLLTATSPPVQEFSTQIKKYSADADTVLGLLGWNSGAIVEAAMKDSLKKGDLTQKSLMKSLHGLGGQQVGVLKTVGWTASDTHSMDAGNTDVFSIYQVKDGVFVKVGS